MRPQPTASDEAPGAVYVHVPFCARKCAYCDFYSVELRDPAPCSAYLGALRIDIAAAPRLAPRTVYVGGGTPTVLPPTLLGDLLAALRSHFDLSAVEEFTFESNPGVLDAPAATLLLRSGVNRISLGVQSFNPRTLDILGRIHTPVDVRLAVDLLRRLGLANLSLDLIFAVPGQTLDDWLADLHAAIALDPEHLSVYGLSIPPDTPLGRRVASAELAPLPDDLYVEMLEAARDRLRRAGYEHYEISNFARPGLRCRHNVTYWRNRPYLGLGPAATSYLRGRRSTNVADLAEYAARLHAGRSPALHTEELDPEMRARETAILNLRMLDGITVGEFRQATGFDPLRLFHDAIHAHQKAGLIELSADSIRLTSRALPVADAVLADFLP